MNLSKVRITKFLAAAGCVVAILPGCREKVNSEPQRMVVRYVEAAAVTAANTQSRSEYLAMVRGDVETDLGFKVSGVLGLIGRAGEKQDWQEGVGFASGEVLAQLKQEDFISSAKSARAKIIGGNKLALPVGITEALFRGLNPQGRPMLFLKIALASAYDGFTDLRGWQKSGLIEASESIVIAEKLGLVDLTTLPANQAKKYKKSAK